MLCKSELIDLPSVKVIKEILSKCSQDTNQKTLFDKPTAEQGLVKVSYSHSFYRGCLPSWWN